MSNVSFVAFIFFLALCLIVGTWAMERHDRLEHKIIHNQSKIKHPRKKRTQTHYNWFCKKH